MSTATATKASGDARAGDDAEGAIDMVVHLRIGEGNLDRYLEIVGDSRYPLVKYRAGGLTLVSPSRQHDRGAFRVGRVVMAVCEELNIRYAATRSTLYRRPDRDHGIEADESFYIANLGAVSDIEGEPDLSVDPPPDLAVEAVYANPPENSLAVYLELGVPEVWVFRVKKPTLEFLHLGAEGRYAAQPASRSFPFLTPADVLPWVDKPRGEADNDWARRLREWVRDELAPRYRPAGGAV